MTEPRLRARAWSRHAHSRLRRLTVRLAAESDMIRNRLTPASLGFENGPLPNLSRSRAPRSAAQPGTRASGSSQKTLRFARYVIVFTICPPEALPAR